MKRVVACGAIAAAILATTVVIMSAMGEPAIQAIA
jgi:hypothetical protein